MTEDRTLSKVAIITARGGSKRIPGKNVKKFLGRPIIEYSIRAALDSGVFSLVLVSTDDETIAQIARDAGASVPFMRSEENANDFATTADVVSEVLTELKNRGMEFDAACCIYPTAPFITPDVLKEAMKLLEENQADSVLPVVKFSFPPQRCVVIKEGMLEPKWPEYQQMRSQDLEPFYHDAGQFYAIHTNAFYEQHSMVMKKTLPLILDEMQVQDIDTVEDWEIAEIKYRLLHQAEEK